MTDYSKILIFRKLWKAKTKLDLNLTDYLIIYNEKGLKKI